MTIVYCRDYYWHFSFGMGLILYMECSVELDFR